MEPQNLFKLLRPPSAAQQFDRQLNDLILGGLREDEPEVPDPDAETQRWVQFSRQSSIISGKRVIPFDPYEWQITLFRLLEVHPGAVLGKVRQFGATEFYGSRGLFKIHDNPAYKMAIFSISGEETAKVAERVKLMALTNPSVEIEKANTRELKVRGGGAIYFLPSTLEKGRSFSSLTELVFDEWGFLPDTMARSIFASVTGAQGMVADDARISVVCTPPKNHACQYMEMLLQDNGDRDVFDIARQMREGKIAPLQWWADESNWIKMLLHWKGHPVYGQRQDHLARTKKRIKGIDEISLQREHNLNFDVRDSESLVDMTKLGTYRGFPPEFDLIVQSWDTAQTTGAASAKWGHVTFGLVGNHLYWLEMFSRKMMTPEGEGAVLSLAQKWSPHIVLIENKSSGIDIVNRFKDSSTFPCPVKAITPPKSSGAGDDPKARRFAAEVHWFNEGYVYLPEVAPWLTDAKTLLETAPTCEERDVMDALSQLLRWVREEREEFDEQPDEDIGIGLAKPNSGRGGKRRR